MNRNIRYIFLLGIVFILGIPAFLSARCRFITDSAGNPWMNMRLNAVASEKPHILIWENWNSDLTEIADPADRELEDQIENKELSLLEKEIRNNWQNQRALTRLLQAGKIHKAFTRKRYKERLLNNLSDIAAGLNLYPLAMSYRQMQVEFNDSIEGSTSLDTAQQILIKDRDLETNMVISGLKIQTNTEQTFPWDSEPIAGTAIISAFNDQKESVRYAMLLQVKQPKAGSRKSFTGIDNVGHMFVTLIKYNSDSSYVCRSFGFYPAKSRLLHATPLHPGDDPVIKDDTGHEWDVAIGKFISARRFQRILRVLNRFETTNYHLSKNNCTDFGLTIAAVCGITIPQSQGKWPLGSGNNPANAGQSILEGKVIDSEADGAAPVFLFNKLKYHATVTK